MPTDLVVSRTRPVPPTPVGRPAARAALRALADPIRAAILDLLVTEQLCVCHLQEALGAKQTLVSHHLRALRDAGMVESEPAGRYVYYRLAAGAFDTVRDLTAILADASMRDLPRRPC